MRSFSAFIFALIIPLAGCGKSEPEQAASSETNATAVGKNPLTAPTDYLGAIGNAKKSMEGTIALTSINQAIQFFQAAKGRNPKSLQELIDEGQLARLPKAPYGSEFTYSAGTGQVTLKPATP
jgi:hypothetical protein